MPERLTVGVLVDDDELRTWAERLADANAHGAAAVLFHAADGVNAIADTVDRMRAERDAAQDWAELIGQAVVGILGIHPDEVPDKEELLRLTQAEASTREHLRAQILIVHAHINQRPEYITALRNNGGGEGGGADYCRWTGHAAARRQLAEKLGLTVPYELGETAQPKAGE